jgi:uncharacterized membrane protein
MRAHLFWAAVALAAAIVAHAAFTLYVPGWWFSRSLARLAAVNGQNTFFILNAGEQAKLFPGLPRFGVTGICLFDVSKGDVTFSADLPDGFWLTTIYTNKAEPVYSVNNRQSGENMFTVRLSLAPGLLEQVMQATEKEAADTGTGWTVESPEASGLAVVWYPVADADLRPMAEKAVARSRCTAAPAFNQGTE